MKWKFSEKKIMFVCLFVSKLKVMFKKMNLIVNYYEQQQNKIN